MADWGTVYTFDSNQDLTTRVTRLERGRQYFRAGSIVIPSGNYAAVPTTLIDANNKIALVSGISPAGNIAPFGRVGNFAFTATSTSITMYWDGTNGSDKLSLIRADNSAVQITPSNITVTGLTPSTSYGFLPFWSTFNDCGIGFVVGDSGTPAFAFSTAAQTVQNLTLQSLQGREALSSTYITFSTPASGSSSGGGGGGIHCVMLGTHISPLGEGKNYSTTHYRHTDWINLASEDYPRTLNCTPEHPVYHADKGKITAEKLKVGDWLITDNGEVKLSEVRMFYRDCTKMEVSMPCGHLFYANGFMSHNVKLQLA